MGQVFAGQLVEVRDSGFMWTSPRVVFLMHVLTHAHEPVLEGRLSQ